MIAGSANHVGESGWRVETWYVRKVLKFYPVEVLHQHIPQVEVEVVELYYVVESGSLAKLVCSQTFLRMYFFVREPVEAQSVIANVEQDLFCLTLIIYCHSSLPQ